MIRRLLIVLTLVACAVPAPAVVAQGRDTQTERTTRSVNIGANGEIELSNISGDIVVTRGSGTAAQIEVVKTARAASADEARALLPLVQVEITERGTRAEARTRYPAGDEMRRNNRRNVNVSVAFNVAAPEGTRIIVKSISGNISVRDIMGGLTLETISGTVRIINAGRIVNGRSISGDIELADTKVEGALEAGTISGTVRLRKLTARSLALNSVSGNVEMEDVDGGTDRRAGHQRKYHLCRRPPAQRPLRAHLALGQHPDGDPGRHGLPGRSQLVQRFHQYRHPDHDVRRPERPAQPGAARHGGQWWRGPRSHDLLGHDSHHEALGRVRASWGAHDIRLLDFATAARAQAARATRIP